MADVRIKDLAVTATTTTSDDYLAIDGTTNNTRKVSAYSPTFSGGLNSTPIGASSPNTGAFTSLSSSSTTTLNGTTIPASSTLLTSGGALGTPSSGTVTNLTGTASININGTVGATTPSTGAFTTLSATTSALVSNNGDTASANYPSTNTRIGGSFDGQLIMTMLSYGSNTAIVQGVAGGTKASPTQTTSGSALMILGGYGYNTTNGWGGGSGSANARIVFSSTENHTNTAQGSKISFDVTPNTTASRITAMTIDQSGNVGIGTTSPAATLDAFGGAAFGAGGTTGFNITLREYTTGTVRNWGIRDDSGINRLRFARGGSDYAFWDVLKTSGADSVSYNQWKCEAGHQWYVAGAEIVSINGTDLQVTSGKGLKLGNAYVAGAPTATGYVIIKDSTGTSYKIPAVAV